VTSQRPLALFRRLSTLRSGRWRRQPPFCRFGARAVSVRSHDSCIVRLERRAFHCRGASCRLRCLRVAQPADVMTSSDPNSLAVSHPLVLRPRAPFRLDLTVWALRRQALNEVDAWNGSMYRRVLVIGGAPVEVHVAQSGGMETPALHLTLSSAGTKARLDARVALEKMLSLEVDIGPFYTLAAADPRLAPLVARFRGLRPPRFASVFECLVNAVALQQLSLAAGLTLLNRLSRTYGARSRADDRLHAFPTPEELAGARPASVHALGFSLRKATTILAIAEAAGEGRLDLESFAALADEQVVETLTQIRGIGRWSAEYTLLRGLGRLHVFPGDDVGARKNLARWLGFAKPLDYGGVQRAVAGWRPFAGLVYFHLLLDRLAARGDLE
jgi:DNA-3-methyladenine glycosylase II